MLTNYYLKKRRIDNSDNGYSFEKDEKWRNAKQQKSFGTEWLKIEALQQTKGIPKQLEFELYGSRPLKFNGLTRFQVAGRFETKETNGTTWAVCEEAEAKRLLLAPNWFEMLLSSIDVFYGNDKISTHDVNSYVDFHMNTMAYYYMHPDLKKVLCPQACHPANHMPTKKGDFVWGNTEAETTMSGWEEYAKHVFLGADKNFEFQWVPLHVFPFYQHPNWILDADQTDLPFPHIGKMFVRFNFKEDQSCIFRRKAGNNKKYRFVIDKFFLWAEEDRQSPVSAKIPKRDIVFRGLSKDSRCESIMASDVTYRTRFQRQALPEQLMIVALSKNIISNTWKVSDIRFETDSIFLQHNISEVQVVYNGMTFVNKEPNFQQQSCELTYTKYMLDVLRNGIFGVAVDPSKITYDELKDSTRMLFPHVLMDFTLNGTHERIQPIQSDGTALKQDGAIEVNLKFNATGATADAAYVIFCIYKDHTLVYDLKSDKFINRYKNML